MCHLVAINRDSGERFIAFYGSRAQCSKQYDYLKSRNELNPYCDYVIREAN